MAQELLLAGIGVALFFAFWNGFTDAANAISTIVATRVLAPAKAVVLSAMGNFIGLYFGGQVAITIWRGILDDAVVRGLAISAVVLVIAAVLGGLVYDVITWYFGLPVSETHVLIGSLVGAGLFFGGANAVLLGGVVNRVVLPMIYSPLIAFAAAFLFAALIIRLFRRHPATRANRYFRNLQLVSSFFFSFSHGSQDGQKTVGIILLMLAAEGLIAPTATHADLWVITLVQVALSLGTLLGGWRIVRTMAMKITKLRPYQGFAAETSGALVLVAMAQIGAPISTTHAISTSIMGVGATQRVSAVRWGIARRIVGAWILTLPAAAFFAYVVAWIAAILLGVA
ncbi:MAG TPA: inorganic phosphate transporter [Thermoplasmata archaeon]|nr:inorganic phosphate transporter [Thermoplasmata archaeon]